MAIKALGPLAYLRSMLMASIEGIMSTFLRRFDNCRGIGQIDSASRAVHFSWPGMHSASRARREALGKITRLLASRARYCLPVVMAPSCACAAPAAKASLSRQEIVARVLYRYACRRNTRGRVTLRSDTAARAARNIGLAAGRGQAMTSAERKKAHQSAIAHFGAYYILPVGVWRRRVGQ